MRDQPFKRFFPSQKKPPKEAYKYPTYQHYYEPKVSELGVILNPKKTDTTQPPIHEAFASPPKKTLENARDSSKKDAGSSLKTELEHLKNEVHKIMEKKQGILRSPIDKRLSANARRPTQTESQQSEDSDTQSVSSDKIFGETNRKLQVRRASDNYDYSKYMQLENNLLKTELRNLKNKYLNKKRQLTEKCEALDQKVSFLENALFKSEQALANEVALLKDALRDAQKGDSSANIPTSDKEAQPRKALQENHSELIGEKMKALYEELNHKNTTIFEQETRIETLEGELRKTKKQSSGLQEKNASLLAQLEENRSSYQTLRIKYEHANIKAEKLERINQQLTKDSAKILSQETIEDLKVQFDQQIKALKVERSQLQQKYQKCSDELFIAKEDLKYYKQQLSEKQLKIQSLGSKYQASLDKIAQIEINYAKTIDIAQKKHEELVKSLQNEIYSKVTATTPKKDSKQKQSESVSPKTDKEGDMQDELKRWKIEYKILKQRHEAYMKVEEENKLQLKQYFRSYRESKQRIDVLTHKNKLLQRQFDKYMKAMAEKDAQLLKKEIELRKTANEAALEKTTTNRELLALKDRCKALEDKLSEETQRAEKEVSYRKDIEQKILGSEVNEESLKGVIERTKKRLAEQDEKISKNVKETKNKQALIQKLKQELRELMESAERDQAKKNTEEVAAVIEEHLKKEGQALLALRERLEKQTQFAQEQQKATVDEIQQLKLSNYDLNRKMVDISNQLRLISHSYNTKTMEMSNLLFQRSKQLENLQQSLQEAQVMAISVEGSLREELNQKNEEIALLRREVISRLNFNSGVSLTGTFDEVLRNQMEGNAKLREEASKRAEEIYKLRDNYSTIKSQYQNLKSQSDINKLKFLSEKKNLEVAFQVQTQNYKNIIDGWEKKVTALEHKIKMLIQQNQKKDQFIKNFIIGKKISSNEKEVLNDFMQKFQISMGSEDIVKRLMDESKLIENLEKYNQSLLKEVATMKEKLTLFEAMEIEKISLYESKLSWKSHKSIQQKDLEQVNQETELHISELKKAQSLQDLPTPERQDDHRT